MTFRGLLQKKLAAELILSDQTYTSFMELACRYKFGN